jgi:hypothetical protein
MAWLKISGLLLSAALQVAASSPAVSAPRPESINSMRIDPTEIGVGLFYKGASVHVEGVIPAGYDAAILCRGQESSVELKRKGKVGGFLWMNVAEVVFEDVPSLYLLSTSSALAKLAPPSVLEELEVGYPALESRALRSSARTAQEGDFREFLKLKESEKLYSYEVGRMNFEPRPDGAIHVSAECWLPTKAPWGEYEVRLFGFEAGRGELLGTERLQLGPVGVTARVSALATRHGLLYGILAVLIALGVGLLTGLAFGLASKKGH